MTRCSSNAARISPITRSDNGRDRSTPAISAPSAPAIGLTEIVCWAMAPSLFLVKEPEVVGDIPRLPSRRRRRPGSIGQSLLPLRDGSRPSPGPLHKLQIVIPLGRGIGFGVGHAARE